jgi:hypothetical protein
LCDSVKRVVVGLEASINAGNPLWPWNRGWPDAEGEIGRLNELVRDLGASESVEVMPFHDTLQDPSRPGLMRAGTDDGDHPSIAGYRRLGELASSCQAGPFHDLRDTVTCRGKAASSGGPPGNRRRRDGEGRPISRDT